MTYIGTFIQITALAALLIACAPPVYVNPTPVVVVTQPPAPTPAPAPAPTPTPPAPVVVVPTPTPVISPLSINDSSVVTVTLNNGSVFVNLTDDNKGTWLRVTLPNGTPSGITDTGACHCIGLGGQGAHGIAFNFLSGITISVSDTLDGPFTTVATLN